MKPTRSWELLLVPSGSRTDFDSRQIEFSSAESFAHELAHTEHPEFDELEVELYNLAKGRVHVIPWLIDALSRGSSRRAVKQVMRDVVMKLWHDDCITDSETTAAMHYLKTVR